MIVEAASNAEMPFLCSLFNQARACTVGFPNGSLDLDAFSEVVAGEHIIVARMDGEIGGFAAVWAPDRFLHHLYVSPRYQRQGVGKKLVDECIDRFGLPMSLKCIEANIEARHFYEALGWRVADKGESTDGTYLLYVKDDED